VRAHCARYGVSIHAPVKDATKHTVLDCETFEVSIHAPVKDATRGRVGWSRLGRFNPRAREGRDA